jgi:hypothetical protein
MERWSPFQHFTAERLGKWYTLHNLAFHSCCMCVCVHFPKYASTRGQLTCVCRSFVFAYRCTVCTCVRARPSDTQLTFVWQQLRSIQVEMRAHARVYTHTHTYTQANASTEDTHTHTHTLARSRVHVLGGVTVTSSMVVVGSSSNEEGAEWATHAEQQY